MKKEMKWHKFEQKKGSRQKRPPIKKYVLVQLKHIKLGFPDGIAVGYRKDAAGDKQCPHFIVPGLHTGRVLRWCDCLPDNFEWPKETEFEQGV